ncbi:hypothetical protein Tco_1379236, partial [Tanacetum coccineum]
MARNRGGQKSAWLLEIRSDLSVRHGWFMVVAQMVYILSGTCCRAWSGFSWAMFSNLWGFIKLSLASVVMLCLETWYVEFAAPMLLLIRQTEEISHATRKMALWMIPSFQPTPSTTNKRSFFRRK